MKPKKEEKLAIRKSTINNIVVRTNVRTGLAQAGDPFSETCGGCPHDTALCRVTDNCPTTRGCLVKI